MIVDDHADMRKVLKSILFSTVSPKLKVYEYASGEEAILGYKLNKPDCVLMDIELKSMSGFEVVEQIYGIDPSAQIIMVTSYDTSSFRKKAALMKVQGFVSKDALSEITPILSLLSHEN